jgi:enoyl-CoA hydratase/carnithine racemase
MIAAVDGVTFRLALDALCAVDMLWAASDAHATFSIKEVEIWLAAGMGTLVTYVAWRKRWSIRRHGRHVLF